MYWQLSVAAFAALWLFHRAYVLATMPLQEIVKTLNVEIPRAATMSVDNITDTAVSIHWDGPSDENEQKIAQFLLFLNGRQVGTLGAREVHTCLSKLNPSTKYRIDLVTVNHKGYKSRSRSVYIKTKSTHLQSKGQTILIESPEALFKLLTDNSGISVEKLATVSTTAASGSMPHTAESNLTATPNGRGGGRSRSNTTNSMVGENASMAVPSINLQPDPKSIEDIEDLRYYLESRQEELHIVLSQQSQALQEFDEQNSLLQEERQKLRERKRLEDGNRSSMKSEINMLDETRRLAKLKKEKQEAAHSVKLKTINKMDAELKQWNTKIEQLERELQDISLSEDNVHRELDEAIKFKKSKVKELQDALASIEEDVKQLVAQKKQKDQSKPQLIKIFRTIARHTDSSGLFDSEGMQSLKQLNSINPSFGDRVNAELAMDSQLEANWRAEQQRAVSKCDKARLAQSMLSTENDTLRSLLFPESSVSPPQSHPSGSSQALPALGAGNLPYPAIPQSTNNSSSGNSFNSGPHFSGSTSPPSGTTPLQHQAQLNSIQASLWNTNGFSSNSKPTNRLSLSTNLNRADLDGTDDYDSPSMNRFLPADLIGDALNGMSFPLSPDQGDVTSNDKIVGGQGSTPLKQSASLLPGSSAASYAPSMPYQQDLGINLTSKNLFPSEFGSSAPNFRPSFELPSSPPQSFQHEFLSAHNSPSTNNNNNDMASLFSGGAVDVLPTFSQATTMDTSKSAKNAFSPRRLSNVFGFGNKNKTTIPDNQQPLQAATTKHSKFFHMSSNSEDSQVPSQGPLFKFNQQQDSQATSSSSFNILDVWKPNVYDTSGTPEMKSPSLHSTGSPLEKDTESWNNFHNKNSQSIDSKYLAIPSAANSVSSQAMSDSNNMGIGSAVQRVHTNKSASGTVKSKSSGSNDLANSTASTSSPGFFRIKSNLLKFGHNNQPTEKSPVKQQAQLSRTYSPTKIDQNDDMGVEEYNPVPTSTPSKKLFARRKSSNTNMRKQSNSSHETEHPQDQTSLQSGSTANSRSLVRKLSLFGKNSSSNKETHVIDEHANEDE